MRRALLVAVAVLAACSSGGGDQSKDISRADLGDAWPLTVDSGTLACEGSDGAGAVTFRTAGTTYAVNGIAKSKGGKDIGAIWAANPDIPGTKKDIGPLIDEGLRLCE